MNNRIRKSFLSQITETQKNIEELKSTQVLGGASFVNYEVSSSGNYDIAINMNSVYKPFRVTFTHTEPGKYHIVNLAKFYRVNNPNVMADPEIADSATGRFMRIVREQPQLSKNTWIVNAIDFDQGFHTPDYVYYVKLFFKGTTDGTFSATLI